MPRPHSAVPSFRAAVNHFVACAWYVFWTLYGYVALLGRIVCATFFPSKMTRPRYVEHGILAPYLEQYPGLFGLYKDTQYPVVPVPRIWPSKERREAGARNREQAIIWLDPPYAHFLPPEPTSRSSVTSAQSPLSSLSSSPQRPVKRLPTFEERRQMAREEEQQRERKEAPQVILNYDALRNHREWRPPSPGLTGMRLATFAERSRALQQDKQQQRQERHKPPSNGSKDHRPATRNPTSQPPKLRPPPPKKYAPPRAGSPPPPKSDSVAQLYPPPPPPPPAACLPRAFPELPPEDISRPSNIRYLHQAQPELHRRNAVRRTSRFFQPAPYIQTSPEVPLPELSRLDRLMEMITNLANASSAHLAPSHSHIYSHPLRALPRDVQTKLTNLHAYLSVTPHALLPDQDSSAARWTCPFRLFPHIRAHDSLSGYDGLAMNPSESAKGRDSMSARWRVMNRIGREPGTYERRQYLPSLIALMTALELVVHLRACVARRGAEVIAEAQRQGLEQQRQQEAERARKGKRLRRRRGHEDLNAARKAGAQESREKSQVAFQFPHPLDTRLRRIERIEIKLRWQIALVAEAIWGRGPRSSGHEVRIQVRRLQEELEKEGFWVRYDWTQGLA